MVRRKWRVIKCNQPWQGIKHTLPETNIAPENWWLEDDCPFVKAYFQNYVSFSEGNLGGDWYWVLPNNSCWMVHKKAISIGANIAICLREGRVTWACAKERSGRKYVDFNPSGWHFNPSGWIHQESFKNQQLKTSTPKFTSKYCTHLTTPSEELMHIITLDIHPSTRTSLRFGILDPNKNIPKKHQTSGGGLHV